MSANDVEIAFNRDLHQAFPNPLAHAYRKAYNSASPKELHDNACLFGLCLLRFLSALGLALLRDLRVTLNREEADLLEKLDRPSEGDWHRWLERSTLRWRESQAPPDSLGGLLDAYLYDRRDAARSDLPGALGQLLSHVDRKTVVRRDANAHDFLLTLIRYRNDTMGHGAVLPEEINQANGEAILRAATELAATLPLGDAWELKQVAKSSLGPTSVDCQLIHLMGPDWLRGAPVSYPRGYPAPLAGHVVLLSHRDGDRHLDLHPLLVFQNERVLFFNGMRGKSPTYLEYDTAQKVSLEALAQDYREWKGHFGGVSEAVSEDSASKGTPEPAPRPDEPSAQQSLPPSGERFRFDRLLGQGGMGEVWSAYDQALKRQVAIKRVRGELLGSTLVNRRFLQEARDAARLGHPNIVPILSVDSDSQGPYLVLEYMEGGSLRQLLKKGQLQLPFALAYLRQLLQALEHAHEHGLIHRDVKPENILLTKAGVPKLADFGLAWFFEDRQGEDLRVESTGEGTRTYMAPELRDDAAAPTPQSDLYSLGVTFYEMLTARSPQRIEEKRVPSSALPLLRKLVQTDPNLRYDTAKAALHDCLELERALELAGRTQEETLGRIRKTAEQSFQLLTEGRPIDAQAGFERILAEDPEDPHALTGLLFVSLMAGDMERSAARYRALVAAGAEDAAFARFRTFIDGIPMPAVVSMTPQPLPYSYRLADLRQGHLVKDLVEFSADTLNLGDVGEILVELCQQRPGRSAEHNLSAADRHHLRFNLDQVQVEADFRYRIKPRAFFLPPRLLATDVTLTISGERFEIYRFVRFLTSSLAQRFNRSATDLVRPQSSQMFGHDVLKMQQQWERLTCNLREQLAESRVGAMK